MRVHVPLAAAGPVAAVSLVALAGSTPAAPPTVASPVTRPVAASADAGALRLLERSAAAPSTVRYQGSQFVSAWTRDGSTSLVVEMAHDPATGTTVSTAATASTPARRTHLPPGAGSPSLLAGGSTITLLRGQFSLSSGGVSSVAGRVADVLVVTRPAADHPAARFWVDRDSGLILRREVYDEAGRVMRASAFVDVTVDNAATPQTGYGSTLRGAAVGDSDASPTAWPYPITPASLATMRSRGWDCPDRMAGGLQLLDARRGGGHYDGIVHLSYSDGLASVSVFEQRGRLDTSRLGGYRKATVGGRSVYREDGVPERVVFESGGTVYTVVADASSRTVGRVVDALPRPTDHGPLDRLGRGLDRVASWFNPFG